MEDLKNKLKFKVVYNSNVDPILYDIRHDNISFDESTSIYSKLNDLIDISVWVSRYHKLYDEWLNDKSDKIYNIKSSINMEMINALFKFNREPNYEYAFYWFDIDRTDNDKFEWVTCPLSGSPLILLDKDVLKINSLISTEYPLIFPRYSNI